MSANDARLQNFDVRIHQGVVEFPLHYMRGGTSTGVVIAESLLPQDQGLRAELLCHLMGVPLAGQQPGNRQTTGLGRGSATSNKVFLVRIETLEGRQQIVSTLAQMASDHADIDWSVNCGNMSCALPLWAIDCGLIHAPPTGACDIDIRNTNTGVLTLARMGRDAHGRYLCAEIPGVHGAFPSVDLFLQSPVGNKTGALLPTGAVVDVFGAHQVSCVDVAVPMVIAGAASFGKTGHETIAALEADAVFMAALKQVWVAAGVRMGLRRRDGELMSRAEIERSETVPKVCIVGAPRGGGNIAVRYFTPQTGHSSMAVSGGCCLAAACLIPGTTAYAVAQGVQQPGEGFADIEVSIENPAGQLDTTVVARRINQHLEIKSAAYRRSAQILMRGHVPLYRASPELISSLSAEDHYQQADRGASGIQSATRKTVR